MSKFKIIETNPTYTSDADKEEAKMAASKELSKDYIAYLTSVCEKRKNKEVS